MEQWRPFKFYTAPRFKKMCAHPVVTGKLVSFHAEEKHGAQTPTASIFVKSSRKCGYISHNFHK